MKKFGDNSNQTSEQEYAGLTLKELENKLVTEGPEGRIKNIVRVIIYWGRSLLAISLAAVLIWGAFYTISLKKEINELRGQLISQTAGLTQAENAGQNQLAEVTPPVSPIDPSQNSFIMYSVQSGDKLTTISSVYYSREDFAPNLAELNGIPVDSQLNVGQKIKVPEKPYESWTSGDS
jgi:hypothetical protein